MVSGAQATKKKENFEASLTTLATDLSKQLKSKDYKHESEFILKIIGEDKEHWRNVAGLTLYFPPALKSGFQELEKLLKEMGIGARIMKDELGDAYLGIGPKYKSVELSAQGRELLKKAEEQISKPAETGKKRESPDRLPGEESPKRGWLEFTPENLGLVPKKEKPAEAPAKKLSKADAAKLKKLEKQLEKQLAVLRSHAEAWQNTELSRLAQGYKVLMDIRSSLEKNGSYVNTAGSLVYLDTLLAGEGKKEGEIVRIENAIKSAQESYRKATELLARMEKIGADTKAVRGELESLQARLGKEPLSYKPSQVRVKNEEGGYDVYEAKRQKRKTVYALTDVEEAEQQGRKAATNIDEYSARLYALGLNDSQQMYKIARETLAQNLSAEQLDALMDYATGKREGLSLGVPAEKQGEIERAIRYLCNVNGFSSPAFEPFAAKGKIEISGIASPFIVSDESVKKLKEWAGPYLTEEERNIIASRFSYNDISKMIDFIDRSRLALSQGREPLEHLCADHAVLAPQGPGGIPDLKTERALNALFLYAGGLSVSFYENAGYVYTTGPAMYAEPEAIQFAFPRKISHKENKPGAKQRWLRVERMRGRTKPIEEAINGRKGGEILFGKPLRGNVINTKLLATHLRQAEIIVGYLHDQGINAKVDIYSVPGPRGTERKGIKVVIPPNAMEIGEVQRKPRSIEVAEVPLLREGPAKFNPEKIKTLPVDIASEKTRDALYSRISKGEKLTVKCKSQNQAMEIRNWLIMNAGVPQEKLEIVGEEQEREATTEFAEASVVRETRWMLVYSPETATVYSLKELEPRGKKEPVHLTAAQAGGVTVRRAKALGNALDGAAARYEEENPGMEVEIEFSQAGGSRKNKPTPTARETFHNESAFGDAFLAMAFEFAWRTERDLPKAPAVGGYRRLRDAMQAYLSTASPEGRFRHPEQFAMIMLREWRHPGQELSRYEKAQVSDAYKALEARYGTVENFMKDLSPENALKFDASTNWLAERWARQYDTKGMKPKEVESLVTSLKQVAGWTMMVVIQLEAGPAHYGRSTGKNRPQTPEEHLKGFLLYMNNTEFRVKGESEPRKTYFEYEGTQYNILARRVLTAGPNPDHYVTIPTNDPNKVILYGKLVQQNVQLEDGTWVPAYNVEVLPLKERKVMDKDSLGETSITPLFTGPLPYAKITIREKPEKTVKFKVEERVYSMEYEGEHGEVVKWRGKVPKPRLSVLATATTKQGAKVAPRPSSYMPESEFTFNVMRLVERRSITGTKEERYLALTQEAADKNKGILATKDARFRARSVAELSADGKIVIYRLGEKIIDAEEGARLSESKNNLLEVGRMENGKIVSTSADFTSKELEEIKLRATELGLTISSGRIYLEARKEEIGTYALSKEEDTERAELSLAGEEYKSLVSGIISGQELMDSPYVKIDGKSPKQYEKAYTKAGAAKAGKSRITIEIPLPEWVLARGDDTFFTWGEFTGPTRYTEETRVGVKK